MSRLATTSTEPRWLKTEPFTDFVISEIGSNDAVMERLRSSPNWCRRWWEWRNTALHIDVYKADEFLTLLDIPLAFVPDHCYHHGPRNMTRRATAEQRERALRMMASGMTPRKVAQRLGFNPSTVEKWRRSHDRADTKTTA